NGRNGLLLDRGRLNVALLSDSAQDIGIQAKGIKRHNNSEPPRPGEGRSFQGDYCERDGKNHNAMKLRSLADFVTGRIKSAKEYRAWLAGMRRPLSELSGLVRHGKAINADDT
ncbi:MAG: hypothetical protein E6575_19650, partial [Bradyrhizobium sp.]|nr:hypothetical protein [Bradyrhizobium sp.]